jgi:uncharacterized protein (TIGR02271 family)
MASTTEKTVIAAFGSANEAEAAARDLQSAGIPQQNIFLESQSASGSGGYSTRSSHHEGGVAGWFKSLFQDEGETDRSRYEQAIGSGNYILSVDANEAQLDSIETILNRHNPVDVSTDQATAEGEPARAAGAAATTSGAAITGAVPVVEEELQVGKRRVLRGGVRVYSRVVEQPVQESVNLQEEHVRVDRRKVDRPASAEDLTGNREQVIEVQEFAEQPVVSKQARVVEEVRVGKETTQRTENVSDTVRHTEVHVEPIASETSTGRSAGSSPYDQDFRTDFKSRYGGSGSYDDYSPAYQYGYESASDPRYKGRRYEDVENDLRSEYSRRNPNSTWEKMKDSVRYGWEKVTGNR